MDSEFSTGEVLKQTFSVFFSHALVFGLIAAIVLSPALFFQALGVLGSEDPFDPGRPLYSALGGLLNVLLAPVVTGALTFGVFQHVRGRGFSAGECLRVGFQRMLPVLGVGLLVGLITMLGALLCIVPGVIAACVFAAAVPAAVIERPGISGALQRSEGLTKERRWQVFGVLAGLWVLHMAASMAGAGLIFWSRPVFLVYSVLIGVVSTALGATAGALIYYNLRLEKESIDVDDIAAVFD